MLPVIIAIITLILLGGGGYIYQKKQEEKRLEAIRNAPVACIVSNWTEWSECDRKLRTKTRTRTIEVQPKNKGTPCGALKETTECKPVIDCEMTEWSVWSSCDPSKGVQTRERKIVTNAENGGAACGPIQETQPCKVDCVLEDWSSFSECSSSEGTKTRTRSVKYQALNGGTECGPTRESVNCVVNCVMDKWSNFDSCDSNTGKQTRTRSIITQPLNGGTPCGPTREDQNCRVDCQVGDWSAWNTCINNNPNTTAGTRTRSKPVYVQPLNGGTSCGTISESQPCKATCKAPNVLETIDGQCVLIRDCGSGKYQELTTGACIPNKITLAPAINPTPTIDMSGGATAPPEATVSAPTPSNQQTLKSPGQSCSTSSDCLSPGVCENSICKDKTVASGQPCNGSRRQPFNNTSFKICQSYYNICCPRGRDVCLINQYNPSSGEGQCGGEDAY